MAAFAVGLPLMRLSGLAAGIATFAVLEITNNLLTYDQSIGPGQNAFSSVPQTTGMWQAAIGAAHLHRGRLPLPQQPLRPDAPGDARGSRRPRLRPGISIYRQRLFAFVISGGLAGFAGGLYVHLLPLQAAGSISTSRSLRSRCSSSAAPAACSGAVVGALAVNGLYSFLSAATNGVDVLGWNLTVPQGTAEIVSDV